MRFAVILLAPLFGVLALRAPVMNALPFRDAWFYSGYGWALAHHVDVFGFYYYGVRFPVTLPIAGSTALLGPTAGYLALRYLLLAGTGALLYGCLRRFASIPVACTGVVLLALNPFYLRLVLWDYTSYVGLPLTIAGVALWFSVASRGPWFWASLGSGALIGAAVFANALSATALPAFLLVDGIGALRAGGPALGRIARRTLAAAGGTALVFVAGYLAYVRYLGGFSPRELVQPVIDFARVSDQFVVPLQRPASEWLTGEPRIYAPLLVCLATVVVMGREFLAGDVRARLAQFAVAYTALLWVYRFTVTSAVIETWWAYGMTAVTMAFALPIGLDRLTRSSGARARGAVLAAAIAGTVVTSLVMRSLGEAALSFYDELSDDAAVLVAVLGVGVVASVGLRVVRSSLWRALAAGVLCAVVAVVGLAPPGHLGIRQTGAFSPSGRDEMDAYRAAYAMTQELGRADRPASRVVLWTTLSGLTAIGWANLPHVGGGIQDVERPVPLTRLTPPELDGLRYPTTRAALVLAQRRSEIAAAAAALRQNGFATTAVRGGSWGGGRLRYALIELGAPSCSEGAGCGRARAARAVAQAYLNGYRRRDVAAVCRVLGPELRVSLAGQAGGDCEAFVRSRLARREPALHAGGAVGDREHMRVAVRGGEPGRFVALARYGSIWCVVGGWHLT